MGDDMQPLVPLTYSVEFTVGHGEGQYRSMTVTVPAPCVDDYPTWLNNTVAALSVALTQPQ